MPKWYEEDETNEEEIFQKIEVLGGKKRWWSQNTSSSISPTNTHKGIDCETIFTENELETGETSVQVRI